MATINGSDKSNWLNGTDKADRIDGKGGDDYINAKGGNDLVIGGSGKDIIAAGGGNDTLYFAAGHGSDTVRDFHQALGDSDTIALGTGISGYWVFEDEESGYIRIVTLSGSDSTLQKEGSITLTGVTDEMWEETWGGHVDAYNDPATGEPAPYLNAVQTADVSFGGHTVLDFGYILAV